MAPHKFPKNKPSNRKPFSPSEDNINSPNKPNNDINELKSLIKELIEQNRENSRQMGTMLNLLTSLVNKISNGPHPKYEIPVWNLDGLNQYLQEIKTFLTHQTIDIMLISETHLTDKHHIKIPTYKIYYYF